MLVHTHLLSADEAAAALARAPEWRLSPDGRRIERIVRCRAFTDAIAFVGRVALLAEAAGHHPDIDVRGHRVRLSLTTHVVGGLTERDFALAEWLDKVAP